MVYSGKVKKLKKNLKFNWLIKSKNHCGQEIRVLLVENLI